MGRRRGSIKQQCGAIGFYGRRQSVERQRFYGLPHSVCRKRLEENASGFVDNMNASLGSGEGQLIMHSLYTRPK
jgi:hypothetical protein